MQPISASEGLVRVIDSYKKSIEKEVFTNIKYSQDGSLKIDCKTPDKTYHLQKNFFTEMKELALKLPKQSGSSNDFWCQDDITIETNPELCKWDIGQLIEFKDELIKGIQRIKLGDFHVIEEKYIDKKPLKDLALQFVETVEHKLLIRMAKPLVFKERIRKNKLGKFSTLFQSIEKVANDYCQSGSKLALLDFGAGMSNKIHGVLKEIEPNLIDRYVAIDILPSLLIKGLFCRDPGISYRCESFYADYTKISEADLKQIAGYKSNLMAISTGGMFPYLNSNEISSRIISMIKIGIKNGAHLEADGYMFMPGQSILADQICIAKRWEFDYKNQTYDQAYITDYNIVTAGSGSKSLEKNLNILVGNNSSFLEGLEIVKSFLGKNFNFKHSIPFQVYGGNLSTLYEWEFN